MTSISIVFFLVTLLYIGGGQCRRFTHNILNQSVGSDAPQNRVICQHFTDPDLEAYIKASDDIIISTDLASSLNCSSMDITFVMVRSRHDENPQSVTVQFLYDVTNPITGNDTGKPGSVFYSRAFYGMVWDNISIGSIFNMTFHLKNGDISDDGLTVFSLSDRNLFPPGRRIWVSFFATGPRDFSFAGFEENCLFWATEENERPNTYLSDNQTRNRPYYFIDLNNTMRENLQNWSPANIAEPLIGVNSISLNLAWSVELICHDLQTESPTSSPTMTPTTTMSPSNAPTIPTFSPIDDDNDSIIIIDDNNTRSPTSNYTIFQDLDRNSLIIGILVPIGLFALCGLCCCFCYRRWKRQRDEKKQKKGYQTLERLDPNIGGGGGGGDGLYRDEKNKSNEIELDIFSEISMDSAKSFIGHNKDKEKKT